MKGKTGLKKLNKNKKLLEVESRIGETIESYVERERHERGRSYKDLARELNVTVGQIYYWINKDSPGITSRVPDRGTLEDLYVVQGLTAAEIGRMCDLSGSAVIKQLKKHGIETRRRNLQRPSDEELRTLYEDQGLSGLKLAEKYSVNSTTVYRWLDEIGIERRNGTQQERGIESVLTSYTGGENE